jgi:DNA helicase IV
MRFPKITELDKDQMAIYQGAPPKGSILVSGPPGTGKTVIAFHRAHYVDKLKKNPKVIMFSKVLRTYSETGREIASDVESLTMHQWVYAWWVRLVRQGRQNPPNTGNQFDVDWLKILEKVLTLQGLNDFIERIHWGHLIVDEGQDFPPAMYSTLKTIMSLANETSGPAISVFADENQRLFPQNSTLEQIRQALGLHSSDKNVFQLKKNYRNSKEIAELSKLFYVGLKTGIPDIPDRKGRGGIPTVTVVDKDTTGKTFDAFASQIAAYAKSRRSDTIGVIATSNQSRKTLFNRLTAKLGEENIHVQTYYYQDTNTALKFDIPGVTVLNYQSAKGLEFDAVFIVDPGNLLAGSSTELHVKMTLYVMCSRAREYLNLMLVKDKQATKIISWLSVAKNIFTREDK